MSGVVKEFAVVIVHYHLRPGGVSRVINTTSRAFTQTGISHLILCADAHDASEDLPIVIIPELKYSREKPSEDKAEELVNLITSAAKQRFPDTRLAWHFHNPFLGKNPSLSMAAIKLAEEGHAIVFHNHDLAEDGRPANMEALSSLNQLYPHGPRVCYGFINHRDQQRFLDAGLPKEQSVVLPPALPEQEPLPLSKRDHPLVFMPIRAIRRKNIGEALLLASCAPEGARFAISRAPEQEDDLNSYSRWKELAAALKLPIEFEVTERIPVSPDLDSSFESWLKGSTHLLVTSTKEGFGLAYVEAPALGRPLIGRWIDYLTPDLPERHPYNFYDSLSVPSNSSADFGTLSEVQQKETIRKAATGDEEVIVKIRDQSIPLNEWLANRLGDRDPQQVHLSQYSTKESVSQLYDLYQALLNTPVETVKFLERDKVTTAHNQLWS